MTSISYRGYRFPPDIIQHGVWLYLRFALSFRDVEDLLAERGVVVGFVTRMECDVEEGLGRGRSCR
jgi:putative transposase